MKRQFFSGNTLEQAVMQAARHFGIDPGQVAYQEREKKHGFLKVRRRFVIEVDSAAPARIATPAQTVTPEQVSDEALPEPRLIPESGIDHEAEDSESAEDRAEPSEVESEDNDLHFESTPLSESASVERAVREILRFVRVRAEVSVERRPDIFGVEISNPDRDDLLDREGRILQSMEYLVPRLVRGWIGQGVPVKIDCEGFRADREEELRDLAKNVADQVRRSGHPKSLEPMAPADRRLVHIALADDPDVYTESDGEGYYKRVRVFAEGEGDDSFDDGEYEDDEYKNKPSENGVKVEEDQVGNSTSSDDDEYDDDEYDDDEYDDDEYDDDEYDDDEYDDEPLKNQDD